MPKPVDALPCGSRSTMSTFSPIAARAVPRLMAVVVLPTPPFWLARARTRGTTAVTAGVSVIGWLVGAANLWEKYSDYKGLLLSGASNANNAPVRVRDARDQVVLDIPRFRGLGQFGRYILSLRKQPDRTLFQQRRSVAEQLVHRR